MNATVIITTNTTIFDTNIECNNDMYKEDEGNIYRR